MATALASALALVTVSNLPAAHAAVSCSASYAKSWDNNGGGFGGLITVTNSGDPITAWTLTFTFPGNQRIQNGWDGNYTQATGSAVVTVTNASYNGSKGTGATWTTGFNGSYTGTNNNPSSVSCTGTGTGGGTDTQAPTAPSNLAASGTTATSTNLTWTASTDNVGVAGYDILRAPGATGGTFAVVGTSTTPSFAATGLTAGATFRFQVRARDAAGNLSAVSNTVTVTTMGGTDTQAPTAPTNLAASGITTTSITLTWAASTDNVGVTGYDVLRAPGTTGGTFAVVGTATNATFTDTGLTANTTFRYQVRARDAAGNLSAVSNTVTATTSATTDTQAPTTPSGLAASGTTSSSTNLAWTASTDNVGVTGYDILRAPGTTGGTFAVVGTSTTASFTDGSLSASTTYRFQVRAKDAAGNLSAVSNTVTVTTQEGTTNTYLQEFMTQYNKIKDPANGYFSPEGVPYHSVETLMVEAPDHGHETTSEAFSFWMWLEAQFGRATGNWAPFNNSWAITEQFIIPTAAGQPGAQAQYNASDPADFAPERPQPSQYPVTLNASVVDGNDPLAGELQTTYGNRLMYGMHWLIDVDDVYGYGTGRGASLSECGDNTKRVTYINTYQRGPQESVWETIPHPSCETQRFGQSGQGFPPLFISGSAAAQWRYTDAPDADARAVQAAYWALTWATAQGNQSQVSASVAKAAKMGDFLRYSFYDKYFKNPGCTSQSCTPGSGKSSSSSMLTWYYAWGGDLQNQWAWRIGSSSWHQGYQNPLAAWALSTAGPTALRPQSPTAGADWATSLTRQLDAYLWLQSAEGAIAGGATNSFNGDYSAPPAGTPTFFGWSYDFQPVFHDPPSNRWFGFQAWSLERVAEYYWVTNDAKAKAILDKWTAWAIGQTTCSTTTGTYTFPSDMNWSGAPAGNYSGAAGGPPANPGLHVTVTSTTNDVGVGAAYARLLSWYAAKSGSTTAKATAKCLIDGILTHKDTKGVAVPEVRTDYNRFDDVWSSSNQDGLFVPSGFTGTMPNGDVIAPGKTFLDIRSFLRNDPDWGKVQTYLSGGAAPTFTYHRFWAQADIAMMAADYGNLFPSG
ncbi:fibronectin type III domain-containing protein [Streptosporangiaceae bacterium NEAU-GS5]|nr:fibronectin type III domain-containing protein [Streptosporangiaceae bacterium NEAU-GS5]